MRIVAQGSRVRGDETAAALQPRRTADDAEGAPGSFVVESTAGGVESPILRKLAVLLAAALAVYSALLVGVELRRGGRAAREYLDDPPTPIHFLHVHTEVSAALLFACALAFAGCRRAEGIAGRSDATSARFLDSQVAMFLFFAVDERFRILPSLTSRLHAPEVMAYILLGAGEALLLLGPGQLLRSARPARLAAIAGAALFALSLAMDAAPTGLPLRWCSEDLPKVWGGALFFLFAVLRLEAALDALAFPGIAGAALDWGRRRTVLARPSPTAPTTAHGMQGDTRDDAPPQRRPPAQTAGRTPTQTAQGAPARSPQRNGAPAQRADAPEPDPKHEASDSSAAPPRKLLSH